MAYILGENIKVEVRGDEAIITIDLKHRGHPSSSGKSVIVASTGGSKQIPGTNVTLGLNAYIKGNQL